VRLQFLVKSPFGVTQFVDSHVHGVLGLLNEQSAIAKVAPETIPIRITRDRESERVRGAQDVALEQAWQVCCR
jgi:hypothetical protein